MTFTLRLSLLLAVWAAPALAQTVAPVEAPAPAAGVSKPARVAAAPAAPPFVGKPLLDRVELKDGDTWVFLGDSITHQCLYTQYVEDFFYTRYPKTRLHFHNAGVGGDRAQDALDRFDADVAAYHPKYVTVLLGMNDGAYANFQQSAFDTYQQGMTMLLDKIAAIGATAIPMTPTMFDSVASKKLNRPEQEVKQMYYNGVLSLYGSWLREQATSRGLGFVDMWSPLNDLTFFQRKKDAGWTMIPDAVHPGPTGQVVMATAILNDIVPRTQAAQITIGLDRGKVASRALHGTLGNADLQTTSAKFDFTAEALPWVLPPDAAEGYELSIAGHHFSNEKLTVRDLAPGRYDLKIDGQLVGTYPSGALAGGVELEKNDKTPQYQQALKVALLNQKRTEEAMHPLREVWKQLKFRRKAIAKLEAEQPDKVEAMKADLEKWRPEMQTQIKALNEKVRSFEDEIYKVNQPVVHHYEISLATAPAKPAKAPEAP